MQQVPIHTIVIGDRARKEMGKIEDLAMSIAKYGLLHPIVLDDDNNLIAGGRRLAAVKHLGWSSVPITRLGELNVMQRRELELEENICRENLAWQEEVELRAMIHELKRELYGSAVKGQETEGWGIVETADALGISKSAAARDVALGRAMRALPELAQEKNKSAAFKKLMRIEEQLTREELLRREAPKIEMELPFYNRDCISVLRELPDKSVHCVITDPPWGIELENGTFDDSNILALDTMDLVFRELARVVTSDAHIYVFFSGGMYTEVHQLLANHFKVIPIPLIWEKNTMGATDLEHHYGYSYEPIMYCWRTAKPRKLNAVQWNILRYSSKHASDRIHPTEKPVPLLRRLIELSTIPGEVVLDPFAGSAATLVAAAQLERRFIGCEVNDEMYRLAKVRLVEAIAATTIGEPIDDEEIDAAESDTAAEEI